MDFDELVALSVKHNASDLHLCSGHSPVLRIDGELCTLVEVELIEAQWMTTLAERLLTPAQWRQLQAQGQVDLALQLVCGQRLRAHFFLQRHGISAALRRVAEHCPTLADLEAPAIIGELTQQRDGLILLTGATGSGKSTTLAAMISYINQQSARHIITLEDPIEYQHHSCRSLIQQRELGVHAQSGSAALHAALREDPDVLLLGELRDSEGIRLALTAAETGHLVLATLHTRSATQAIDRLIDAFSSEEKPFVRSQLAASLRAAIAQRLCPRRGGGRIAVFEILLGTPAVANVIREGKTPQLVTLLQTGRQQGMQTFEQGYQQRCGLLQEQ